MWQRLARPSSHDPRPLRADAGTEDVYSRESLQAMIERKRRNDSLRRREFGMLRKLLRQDASGAAMQPLAFHSSIPFSPEERATTLRKINEIEAQMSSQWRPVKARQTARRPAAARLPQTAAGPCSTPGPAGIDTPQLPARDALSRLLRSVVPVTPPASVLRPPASPRVLEGAPAGEDFIHDPEFEEAALRFASGDLAGAEAALRALLAPGHPRAEDVQAWHFLFDLYRASDQPERYDDLAADFARRFQRSPPQWRGLDEVQPQEAGEFSRAFSLTVVDEPQFDWTSPAVLDAAGVASLQEALAGLPQPWRLSWVGLTCLEPGAVAPLALLVAHWARQPVRLQLAGAEVLERILDARTACGDRAVDPAWWALRLDWLRATRRPGEFELVALDYCVTYEVSPPSWDPPLCELRLLGPQGPGETRQPVSALEPRVSVLAASEFADPSSFAASALAAPCMGELAGTLVADAAGVALARLERQLHDADVLVIVGCEHLRRLDFEAAGALANWVAARHREGRTVHLADLHRLVAALLGALGLHDQARITLRRD